MKYTIAFLHTNGSRKYFFGFTLEDFKQVTDCYYGCDTLKIPEAHVRLACDWVRANSDIGGVLLLEPEQEFE